MKLWFGHIAPAGALLLFITSTLRLSAETYDLVGDWSENANPNGVWAYREASNPLPHVEAWQRNLGGWDSPQSAWADSEDGNNRLPV